MRPFARAQPRQARAQLTPQLALPQPAPAPRRRARMASSLRPCASIQRPDSGSSGHSSSSAPFSTAQAPAWWAGGSVRLLMAGEKAGRKRADSASAGKALGFEQLKNHLAAPGREHRGDADEQQLARYEEDLRAHGVGEAASASPP
jgi:hypothetical protein